VNHILVECVDLNDVRNKHFVASSVKDVFNIVEGQKKTLILLKKLVCISNFNILMLMFVICFFKI